MNCGVNFLRINWTFTGHYNYNHEILLIRNLLTNQETNYWFRFQFRNKSKRIVTESTNAEISRIAKRNIFTYQARIRNRRLNQNSLNLRPTAFSRSFMARIIVATAAAILIGKSISARRTAPIEEIAIIAPCLSLPRFDHQIDHLISQNTVVLNDDA